MQLFPVISLVVVEALDIGASILLLLLGGGRRWGRDSWCKRSPGGCVGRPGCWCSGHLFSPHRIQRLVNQKILQNVDDLIFLWEWVRDEVNYYDATPSWAWLKSSNNYFTNRYNEKRYFKKSTVSCPKRQINFSQLCPNQCWWDSEWWWALGISWHTQNSIVGRENADKSGFAVQDSQQ